MKERGRISASREVGGKMAKIGFLTAILLTASLGAMSAPQKALADPEFESFIESMWPGAEAAGIPRTLFDKAFAGVTDPDPMVIKLANNQPEFTSTTSQYLA